MPRELGEPYGDRDPYDGQPYYCKICGVGFAEYSACEEADCALESDKEAKTRQRRRRKVVSDSTFEAKAAKERGDT